MIINNYFMISCGMFRMIGILLFSMFCAYTQAQHDSIRRQLLEFTIDSIVNNAMDSSAFPGAQVLIQKNGEVVLEKAYGHHTYDRIKPVELNHIYDLASVTKVVSGLPVLMKLYGAGLIDLDKPVSNYVSALKKTNKESLSLREILAHQGGLIPYIVFWEQTLKKNGSFKRKTFKTKSSKRFPIRVAPGLYQHKKYESKMKKEVYKSEVIVDQGYRYSGLFFLLMPQMIQDMINQEFESYLYRKIFKPAGAETLIYNPWNKIELERIVPTEYDSVFRKQLIHGCVHDEAAAMLGGVSCNAGLFGSARDLANIFQMYLDQGKKGDQQILPSEAVNEFTRCQYCDEDNRRGLGFDKPPIDYVEGESYVAKSASASSFGHSGFTGTFVWADPEHDLLIVFLSNRVYPSRTNRKLYSMSIRPKIHQAAYDLLSR